jgi:predicted ribosome quality control (RQC) complex YloA/Tae2 family protein
MQAVISELKPLITGRRVDKIYQTKQNEVILGLRSKSDFVYLQLSAQAQGGFIALVDKPEKQAKEPAFCLSLRKHLAQATLIGIEQQKGERVADLFFSCPDELGKPTLKILTIEIMGRHSNIIFWEKENNTIAACSRIVSDDMSRLRSIAPQLRYVRPPKQDKINIFSVNHEEFLAQLNLLLRPVQLTDLAAATCGTKVSAEDILLAAFSGLGKQLAQEIVQSIGYEMATTITADSLTSDSVLDLLWQKISYLQNDFQPKPALAADCTSYTVLSWYADIDDQNQWHKFESVNKLLTVYYGEQAERLKHHHLKEQTKTIIAQEMNKQNFRLQKLQEQFEATLNFEQYKQFADLILINIHEIESGQNRLSCTDLLQDDSQQIAIALNPNLSPSQNAQSYYKQFSKSRARHVAAKAGIYEGKERVAHLQQLQDQVEKDCSLDMLAGIKETLSPKTDFEGSATTAKSSVLKPITSLNGWKLFIGRNRNENDQLISRIAQDQDIWLHVIGVGGAHVLIKVPNNKQQPPMEIIKQAAEAAAYLSKSVKGAKVRVAYTQCRYVRKIAGAGKGLVTYENEKTVEVDTANPLPAFLKSLLK